jgi:superfamily I DNA and RNA helicase
MEKVVVSPRLKTDPMALQILQYLDANAQKLGLGSSVLYYGFPLFRDFEDALFQPSLLLIDANKGVVAIRIVGLQFEMVSEDRHLSELHSIIYSKLLQSRRLRRTRTALKMELTSVLYLPPGSDTTQVDSENAIVSSIEGLEGELRGIQAQPLDAETFLELRSMIEGVKALTRPVPRDIPADGSKPKALVLQKLEEEIANFDAHQRMAALTVPIGPQRIRGLAGSGKTSVLAWKAAHLHMQEPDKKILFTFYTRSLYDSIRRQITRFYRHFRDRDPNWDKLHVLHAWGGRSEPGVYYNACIDHEVMPKTLKEVGGRRNTFETVCDDLMHKTSIRPKYDMVLMDEAQDFPDVFFRLIFDLTNGARDHKTIIWAYDELQSIFEPKMRSPRELFGDDVDGQAKIDLDRAKVTHGLAGYVDNDLILKKCYRNPLEVLVCSHALGLGVYSQVVVQMLQNREHWQDVGYEVESGDFTVGHPVTLIRPPQNSPMSILQYERKEELVKWKSVDSFALELDWIGEQILQLMQEGLKPEDISVICLDDRNAKNYFKALSQRLAAHGVSCNDLLADPFSTPDFQVTGNVTLTSVHKAKGNESPAVLVCGLDAIAYDLNSRRARNRIFTAFTRTKGWLRVSGLRAADPLLKETQIALTESPRLQFNWPDLTTVETLQRDLSRKEERARKVRAEYLRKMADIGISEEDALREFSAQEKSE